MRVKFHAIAGENGAGKSTFIKIITGAIQATSGTIQFEGQEIKNNTPDKSLALGIAAIYQEFNLFPALSVAENIFHAATRKHGMIVRKKCMRKRIRFWKVLAWILNRIFW